MYNFEFGQWKEHNLQKALESSIKEIKHTTKTLKNLNHTTHLIKYSVSEQFRLRMTQYSKQCSGVFLFPITY